MQFFTFIQFNINIILTLSSCSLKFGHNALHFNLYLAVEHTHCKMVQCTLTSIIAYGSLIIKIMLGVEI